MAHCHAQLSALWNCAINSFLLIRLRLLVRRPTQRLGIRLESILAFESFFFVYFVLGFVAVQARRIVFARVSRFASWLRASVRSSGCRILANGGRSTGSARTGMKRRPPSLGRSSHHRGLRSLARPRRPHNAVSDFAAGPWLLPCQGGPRVRLNLRSPRQDCSQASRSALMVSAWVVGMPCGKPAYVLRVLFCSSCADSGPASA